MEAEKPEVETKEKKAEKRTWPELDDRKVTKEDRIRGSLFGLAWGDVFGCPIEGWRENKIRSYYGHYEELPQDYDFQRISSQSNENLKIARKLRPIGLHSDDTQQCLALLHCLLWNDLNWDKKLWTTYIKEAMKTKAFRGYGRNFSLSVGNMNKGVPPEECGSHSAGIGAAMRIGPLGAIFRDNEEALAMVAYENSLITHGTLVAASIAFAVAYAVKLLIDGEDLESIRKKLPNVVAREEKIWVLERPKWKISLNDSHFVSSTLRTIFEEQDLNDRDKLRKFISENAKPHLAANFTKAHVNQGFAGLGGIHGLVMALCPNIHPQQVLSEIVVLGYDVDTVGAICGTVLGARFGTGWIPLDRIMDKARIEVYANALISMKKGELEDKETYMKAESHWTQLERKYQTDLIHKYFAGGKKNPKKMNKKQKERKNKKKGKEEENNSKDEEKREEKLTEEKKEEQNEKEEESKEESSDEEMKVSSSFSVLKDDEQ